MGLEDICILVFFTSGTSGGGEDEGLYPLAITLIFEWLAGAGGSDAKETTRFRCYFIRAARAPSASK